MSTDLSSDDDRDNDSSFVAGTASLRTFSIVFGVLCTIILGAYVFWLRSAAARRDVEIAETRSAQDRLRGEMESSKQQAVSLAAAVDAVQAQTATRYENANREISDVRDQVKDLEGVVVKTNKLLSQGSGDLGARIASKVFQKADLIPVRNRAEAISKALDSLREDFDAWTAMRGELLGGDRGKAIAANENLVGRFASIELPTVTDLEIQTWSDVLPTLVQPMQDALERDEPSLIPLDEYTKRVDDLARKIHDASTAIRKARIAVAAIEQKTQPTQVADETVTLEQALEDHEIRIDDELQTKRGDERQKKIDALAKQLADEDVKDKALAVKIESEEREGQRKAKQAKHEAYLAVQEKKRKLAALEARFQAALPEINSYLRPYTTPGFTQPRNRMMRQTGTEGPVSLTALRSAKTLDQTHQSLVNLMMITTIGNDRPITGFPRFSNDSDMPYLRKVQGLLIEFGPLMVQKEMLAK